MLLIDSHALIWYVDQDHLLSPAAHAAITHPTNVGLKKLPLSQPYRIWIEKAMADLELGLLPITIEYSEAQAFLPNHHKDPFDRLLVAQARVEGLPIVSADVNFDLYGITRIW